ncbi:MAG: Trk family potassium uptake protein [Ignavibacteriae bacterium]|nr:Trk family potassium uptake protein [Ignavibacteriota bacterium]
MIKKLLNNLSPIQLLSLGYLIIILTGAFLLMLPISSTNGSSQNFIDAFFTSTSAISTTGLIVVDTGSYYTLFGQIVILFLLQIGGIGYIAIYVIIVLLSNSKFSIKSKKVLRESISRLPEVNLIKFVKLILLYTTVIESIGVICYYIVFQKKFTFWEAIYQSIFHSISAFCTAGFSLFVDSFCSYNNDWLINYTTYFLVITGAIGFFVIFDVLQIFNKSSNQKKLTLQTKIVLSTSFYLYAIGSILIFITEQNKFSTSLTYNVLISAFQAISASSTVGFNSIDIGKMSESSLFVLVILMFVGGSPGSTAGGIKTISFALINIFSVSLIREKQTPSVFKRSININNFYKSTGQVFIGFVSIVLFSYLLTISENIGFMKVLFEAVSAFGTVGLSTGITFNLTWLGKIYITILMLIGRVGPFALGLVFLTKSNEKYYKYPEEDLFIS